MSEPGTESEAASSARSKGSKESKHSKRSKRAATVNDLVKKLHGRLGHEESLSLTEHLSAAKLLCSIRNRLSCGETLESKTLILLLCSGISCHRRWSVGDAGIGGDATEGSAKDEANELKLNDEAKELVRGTATRIFVLLCMSERQKKQTSDLAGARTAVATAGLTSVWAQIEPRPKRSKKKARGGADSDAAKDAAKDAAEDADAADAAEDGEERREEPSWEVATRLTPGEVARHALTLGVNCLDDEVYTVLEGLMSLFYRNAGANMAGSMLMPSGDQDFVSLAMATPMNALKGEQRAKKLAALSMAAESEAGQSIMRDFLLSFLLPASHVGVRRTLLLTRASSTQAGVDYPELTTRAHEVAMAGAEWIYANGTNVLERMCCIFAGLAVLTTKGGEDPIRKQDAFLGRLQLPFLETAPPAPEALRITLVPSHQRWVLYRLDARGLPRILCSLKGFDGFCDVALQLVASLR